VKKFLGETNMIRLTFQLVDKKQRITYSETEKYFRDLEEAEEFLKEEYGKNTKNKMFIDTKQKEVVHCGYVFSRWNYYHDTQTRYNEEIWVTFYEVTRMDLGKLN